MHFEYWHEAIKFIAIFFLMIMVPCLVVAWMGYKMITKIGFHPSKTPFIQLSIVFKLVTLEVLTFAAIMAFYRFCATANK